MTSDDLSPYIILTHDNPTQREILATKMVSGEKLTIYEREFLYNLLVAGLDLNAPKKKPGRKSRYLKDRALAEDNEKMLADGNKPKDIRKVLGKKHELMGLEDVSKDTFKKARKRGEKYLAEYRKFVELRSIRNFESRNLGGN